MQKYQTEEQHIFSLEPDQHIESRITPVLGHKEQSFDTDNELNFSRAKESILSGYSKGSKKTE